MITAKQAAENADNHGNVLSKNLKKVYDIITESSKSGQRVCNCSTHKSIFNDVRNDLEDKGYELSYVFEQSEDVIYRINW
jgi:hypothetical protein